MAPESEPKKQDNNEEAEANGGGDEI